jgi:hypothetical protein
MGNGRRRKIFKVQSAQRVPRDQMEVMERMVQMERQLVMHLQQQDLQDRKVRKV